MRNAPEKMFVTEFPDLMPPTLITRDLAEIKAFRAEHGDIVMKPLYGHGGGAVFRITRDDLNFGSLYDLFAATFREQWVVQKFLPAVKQGDKRIILVDGEFAGAVNRVPAADDLRSNMVRGGSPEATDLTDARARNLRAARAGAARARAAVRRHRRDRRLAHRDQRHLADRHPRRQELGGPDIAALIWDKIEEKRKSSHERSAHHRHHRLRSLSRFSPWPVSAGGIEPTWLTLGHHEIFSRFTFNREWDVSELSFAKFMAQVTRDDADIIGLPVLCLALVPLLVVLRESQRASRAPKDLRGNASACRNGRTPPPSTCAGG